jgi:hypothetical protein
LPWLAIVDRELVPSTAAEIAADKIEQGFVAAAPTEAAEVAIERVIVAMWQR